MATDSLGFLDTVHGLPEQLAPAHEQSAACLDTAPLPAASAIDHVAVLGMGGSGMRAGSARSLIAMSARAGPRKRLRM